MKKMFVSILTLMFICGAAFAASSWSGDKSGWPTHLRMLTGPNGGQWFMMGEPIANELSNNVLPTTSRIGGGVDNIESLNKKTGDLGFSLACFMGAAASGEAEYQAIKLDNVDILANVYPQVLYVLLRRDFAERHGISDMKGLLGLKEPLRFASLKPGTASEFIVSLLFKYGYDTNFDKLRAQGWQISFNNYAETADHFVSGEIDCFAYTAGTTVPLILTMEKHTEVLVLPIDQAVLDLLRQKFKTGTYVIPPGVYQSVKKPLSTLGDYTTILVRKDLPENLVYGITETLWEGRGRVAGVIADFGGLDPSTALPEGLPVHPGAKRFWDERNAAK